MPRVIPRSNSLRVADIMAEHALSYDCVRGWGISDFILEQVQILDVAPHPIGKSAKAML